MNSWDVTNDADIRARQIATRRFCEYLDIDDPPHKAEREYCKRNSHAARKLFARLGDFQLEENLPANAPPLPKPIPLGTIFHVYDDDPKMVRDERVTIVLPNPGELPSEEEFEPTDHYRCTYPPYLQKAAEQRKPDSSAH